MITKTVHLKTVQPKQAIQRYEEDGWAVRQILKLNGPLATTQELLVVFERDGMYGG